MNKKAAAFKMLNTAFFRLIFITIIMFIAYLSVTSQIRANIDVKEIKHTILIKRILYSPNSIIYTDSTTQRSFPGIIDYNRFKTEILEKTLGQSSNNIAAKLELKDIETDIIDTIYLNKKWYDRWAPLDKFQQYEKTIKWNYVLIKKDNSFVPGLLRIDIVSENE